MTLEDFTQDFSVRHHIALSHYRLRTRAALRPSHNRQAMATELAWDSCFEQTR